MATDTNGYISRGNMTLIMSAVGLVMIAAGAFIAQQNASTDRRITDLQSEIKINTEKSLRKEEHEEFKLRIDKDITRLDNRIMADRSAVVPRSEHEARWNASDATLKLLSERLNEVRNLASSNSTVPLRDEMVRVQTEISDLRKLLLERARTDR